MVSGRDVEYQELTLQFSDLVWELVERQEQREYSQGGDAEISVSGGGLYLDYKSKITSANVMDNILTLPDTRQTDWHT